MPPKASKPGKAEKKKQEKVIDDKVRGTRAWPPVHSAQCLPLQTFGLKNKNKSKKVQQFIATVAKQVKGDGVRKVRLFSGFWCPLPPLHTALRRRQAPKTR